MKTLLTLLFVAYSSTAFAQFNSFTKYEGDCVKRDIVATAFLKKIPQTKVVYESDIISVLKHPTVETYLTLVFNLDGCFIGTDEITEDQFNLMKVGV